ncbi:MAG: hypothetical protein U0802_25525, partial [Candidatus Binatia bacterium]
FAYTLNVIATQHLPLGSRAVSTFGPLGFLFYNAYYPATFAWLLVLRAGLAMLTGGTLAWLGGATTGRPAAGLLVALACLPWCLIIDAWAFLVAALVLMVSLAPPARGQRAAEVAAGIALGLFALVKVTLLIAALVVAAPLVIVGARQRRMPWSLPATAATALGGWIGSGQPLAAAPEFARWALGDIAGGYARAMQMWPHHWLVLQAWLTAGLLVVAALILWWPRARGGAAVAAAGLAGLLLLIFKAGFVRALDHLFITAAANLAIGIVLAAALWARGRRATAAAIVVAPLLLLTHGLARQSAGPLLAPLHAGLDSLGGLAQLGRRDHAALYAAAAANVRYRNRLPPLPGRGDIYPHDAGVLLAHDLTYDPRPVFQSYMAYTGALAERNRAFLAGPDAPDWLLFRLETIDSRYPSLDDGASWPEILSRYDLAEVRGRYLQLVRRPHAIPWRLTPLARHRLRIGDSLAVPPTDAGPIWATIDVRDRPSQRLLVAALQGALVVLEVDLAAGPHRRFRLIPSLARAGFLLSPLVDTTLGFARLAVGQADPTGLSGVRRIGISIEPTALTPTMDPVVDVAFYRLELTPWSARPPGLESPAEKGLVALLRGLQPPEPIGGPALISTDEGREAVNAHAPARFRVPLPPTAREVVLEYGLRDEVRSCSNGVVFRLTGERGGTAAVLFERLLVPRERPADGGPQQATVALPAPAPEALRVETLDNGDLGCDWAYIAALRIR